MKMLGIGEPGFRSSLSVGAFKGAIKDLPHQEYHSLSKYISSSQLKLIASSSPAHYKATYIDGTADKKEPTDKMILGSLVHCLILTPHLFESDFFVMPFLNLRTNDGKATKAELLAANPGKTAIDIDMHSQAALMRDSCLKNKQAAELLESGHKESSFFWECPFSGLRMRARADSASSKALVELKTTSDASPEAFSRHIHNMNYDVSMKHYQEGIRVLMDVSPPGYFIVLEDKPPFVCQVYKAGETVMELGHAKWIDAVSKLERGLKNNYWPGYSDDSLAIQTIECPPWAVNKMMKGDQDGV